MNFDPKESGFSHTNFNDDHDPDAGVPLMNPSPNLRGSFKFFTSIPQTTKLYGDPNAIAEDDRFIHYEDGSMKRKPDSAEKTGRVKVKIRGLWVEVPPNTEPEELEILMDVHEKRHVSITPAPLLAPPNLGSLMRCADWVPIGTRGQIKAMAGDYETYAREFYAAGRPLTAKWNIILAWGTAIRYVCAAPLDMARDYVIGAFKAK